MLRALLGVATCAACTTEASTGPAALTVDGSQVAMSAVMYPSQTIDPISGKGRYRGWVVAFMTDPPGLCRPSDGMPPDAWVAFLTDRLELVANDVVIAPGAFPIVPNVPDPVTATIAVATVTPMGLESGSATITEFDPGARMEGTLSGVATNTATNTTVTVAATFTANACPGW